MLSIALNNGIVVDPVEGEMQLNIGILDGKIAVLSKESLQAEQIINFNNEIVISPGFIDIHMHGGEAFPPYKIDNEIFEHMALMGVTTCLGGNCGLGGVEIENYQGIKLPVNYLGLTGHKTLRETIGCNDRYLAANNEEINKMAYLLERELEKGSAGLSIGFEYTPGISLGEALSLCEVVSKFPGKLVSAHYRYCADRVPEAIAEMIIIARETGVRFQISHLSSGTALGAPRNGKDPKYTAQCLQMIESAYENGVDVMVDNYPYTAFCTSIGSAAFDEGCFELWGTDYSAVEICEGEYKGYTLNKDLYEHLRLNEPDAMVVGHVMNESETILAIQHPLVMIASDGHIKNGQGHPRSSGTFPRVLSEFVRNIKAIDLTTAIKKMTLMPAERLSLKSKGRIEEGFDADLTIFDKDKIIDKSTFQNPAAIPEGIEHVFINGKEIVNKGKITGNHIGEYLYN